MENLFSHFTDEDPETSLRPDVSLYVMTSLCGVRCDGSRRLTSSPTEYKSISKLAEHPPPLPADRYHRTHGQLSDSTRSNTRARVSGNGESTKQNLCSLPKKKKKRSDAPACVRARALLLLTRACPVVQPLLCS